MKTGINLIGLFVYIDLIWFIVNTGFIVYQRYWTGDYKGLDAYQYANLITNCAGHIFILPACIIFIAHWCKLTDPLKNCERLQKAACLSIMTQILTLIHIIIWAFLRYDDVGTPSWWIIYIGVSQVFCFFIYIYSMGIIKQWRIIILYQIQKDANATIINQANQPQMYLDTLSTEQNML